jgi:hypothetical protein
VKYSKEIKVNAVKKRLAMHRKITLNILEKRKSTTETVAVKNEMENESIKPKLFALLFSKDQSNAGAMDIINIHT